MRKLLWFCRTSDSSSLSRITDSVLPELINNFDVTLISNKTNLNGIKNVVMGADTSTVTYKDFLNAQKDVNSETIRCINMKYLLVQIVDLIYDGNFDYLLLCNGIYEIDFIVRMLTSDAKYLTNMHGKRTKLVVWSPIDYIPTMPVIQNVIKCDLFLTMTPVMINEIRKITDKGTIDWVGHGSNIKPPSQVDRDVLIHELNQLRTTKQIVCKTDIKSTDIIILNANKCVFNSYENNVETLDTRKRLDLTVRAFLKVLEIHKNVKLWIHTDLKAFFAMLAIENIPLASMADNIILSNNTLTTEQLSSVYSVCQISLQTSTGEGWSLTNMESAMFRSLQLFQIFWLLDGILKNLGVS